MFDAIVVGGRVAGAPTAMLLARQGHRVLLVDRDRFPSDVLSTHFLWPRGMSYLARWGLLDGVLDKTPSGSRIDLVIDGIRLTGEVPIELLQDRFKSVHGDDAGYVTQRYASVRRTVLDATLLDAAVAAGVEVRQGFTVDDVLTDDGRVVGISGKDDQGARVNERARIVVGADGRRSFIARKVGAATFEERVKCSFAFFSYFSGFNLGHAQIHRRGRLAIGVVPTNFGANMVLVFGPQEWFGAFRRNAKENFFQALRYVSPEIADVVQAQGKQEEKFHGTDDQAAFWRKSVGPGWMLVGDAACFKDQCTAIGMTHAFRDATLAAAAIHDALSGEVATDRALQTYAKQRYLDGMDYYNFVCAQAEMNATRLDEIALFEAIRDDQAQTNRFLAVYGDTFSVRHFMSSRNTTQLLRGRAPISDARYRDHEKELDGATTNLFDPGGHVAEPIAMSRTTFDFMKPPTGDLLERTEEYRRWQRTRAEVGAWPYTRFLHGAPGPTAPITDEQGRAVDGVNFASQDYLGLAAHPAVHEAAARALRDFGPHSAGSPCVLGNTTLSKALERGLSELLQMDHVLLFPTGWAAGFGSIVGLVRQDDYVILDKYAHACLQSGTRTATRRVERHSHLDLDSARYHLENIRSRDVRNGILVVTEGLFSMDSDWPDIGALQELCREYQATLLVDVAHDLGSMGEGGAGQLALQGLLGKVDLVMGSFSKTFASNGGFLAAKSEAVTQYVKMYGGSHMFSNAMSPMQTAVVLETLRIARSTEGEGLRGRLLDAIGGLRDALAEGGTPAMGQPSAIVPVLIGSEPVARRAYRRLFEKNVGANMAEFPIVASGAARFRLQVMATHTVEQARAAGQAVAASIHESMTL